MTTNKHVRFALESALRNSRQEQQDLFSALDSAQRRLQQIETLHAEEGERVAELEAALAALEPKESR